MGCDIHMFLERKVGDKWVMVREVEGHAGQRNYGRFAALAGVRGDGPEAKGLPEDVSDSVKLISDDFDSDGHSHSFMPAKEAAKVILETADSPSDYEKEDPMGAYFDIYDTVCKCCGHSKDVEHRVVFFFDN